MITDASNKERDQINAIAQERRAQTGELGAHHVPLPEKPYGLAAGDEIIFTAQHHIPGQKRIENGTTATILDTSRNKNRITVKTREREPRDVQIDTGEFNDLSLAYAVHVHKGQGLTTETSGILTGSWQTDREHTYVAVSRAREQTQLYVSREDLGEQGLDTDAIERLAERIGRSRAQEASITKQITDRDQSLAHDHSPTQEATTAKHEPHRQHAGEQTQPHEQETEDYEHEIESFLNPRRGRARDRRDDEDFPAPGEPDQSRDERAENIAPEPAPHAHPGQGPVPIDIRQATPGEVQITERDFGDIKLAYSQVYDFHSYTGQQTYVLFGGWQTEHEQGFVAATQGPNGPQVHTSNEPRGDRDIAAELKDRTGQAIEHIHTQQATTTHDASTQEADREPQPDQPTQIEPPDHTPNHEPSRTPEPEPGREPVERDPYIEQAIQDARDRQQAWEQGIEQDRENDRDIGIE